MVKLFADGALLQDIWRHNQDPNIKGLTTNPSLMNKVGIINYKEWALQVLSVVKEKPISFEVFADDYKGMMRQAIEIASWGDNVYVKIPITNTTGWLSTTIIQDLSFAGVKVNVTAIMTSEQLTFISPFLKDTHGAYLSVFAGRIADTGVDPIPTIKHAIKISKDIPNTEVIWASPREILNVVQANEVGCHIITCTSDILKKLPLLGKDLRDYSLETVKMFANDSKGFTL